MKIEELNLSVRARNALRRAGIRTTEQLMSMQAGDLLNIRCVGQKTLEEIQTVVNALEKKERNLAQEPAAYGSYLHGYAEGKEGMRRAVIRELTRMARHMTGDRQEVISDACARIETIEVL